MTSPGHLIRLADLGKRYPDGTVALAGLDLAVSPGEFVAVVGPSGSGKTTLLRVIAGLEPVTGGTLARGTDDIAYVFQEPTLLPWRTVRGNVELVAQLHRVPRERRRALAQHAIEQVGLAEFAGHRPHQLSGGMRMRAALAQALTVRPRLFLLDEPFGALDELTRNRLCDQLQALYLSERFTGVLVTHSVAEAVYLSGRVLVLSPRPGRILADIPVPLDVPRLPDVRYTAEFAEICGTVAKHLGEAR
ncbi:MAG: NitT/TauT family transport system ATP-binding protein [Micromonosporaceae bacterium]